MQRKGFPESYDLPRLLEFLAAVKSGAHVDLEGDGVAEVVTLNAGWEGSDYSLYKRVVGCWKRIYRGGGVACT